MGVRQAKYQSFEELFGALESAPRPARKPGGALEATCGAIERTWS